MIDDPSGGEGAVGDRVGDKHLRISSRCNRLRNRLEFSRRVVDNGG